MKVYKAYVDGSFLNELPRWAFIILDDDVLIYEKWGIMDETYAEHRQVGGELKAAISAVHWAKNRHVGVHIYHDYEGIAKWVTGEWRAKKELTRKYSKYMRGNSKWIDGFTWTKGHSDDRWNNYVDNMMKF